MTRFVASLHRILGYFLAGLLGFMVLNVLFQVIARYIFGNPSSVTEEMARYLLIWLGLLGAAYAAGERLHLAIDLLPSRLEGAAKTRLSRIIFALVFIFSLCALFIGGIFLMYITLTTDQTSAALKVPLGYVYIALPLSGILIMLYSLLGFIDPDFELTPAN